MKKRILYLLCVICLAAGLIHTCMGNDSGYLVKAAENENKTLIVGFDSEFPPYSYKDDKGEYVGFDLDLAQEVCNRNGWTLVKQPIDWDSKDMELNSGSIDCIWSGFTINGRENDYTWSEPYVDNSQVVVVKTDSGIQELGDLAGKIVAVQADSSALAALTSEDAEEKNLELAKTFADLQQISDYNSAFMNLESGAVDAVCLDIGVASYEVKKRGNEFTILEEQISSEQYGVGFKLGNTELRDQVQKALTDMKDDGTFDKIQEKWDNAVINTGSDDTNTETESSKGIFDIVKQLSSGMLATCAIFFLTLIFSLPLGLLITFGRMSKWAPLRWIVKLYISIMRGTPLMLQLLVVFFGPYYIWGMPLSTSYRFYAVIIGFSVNYAAYFAEIYRSGIQAVPVGQYEAASVLGYSKSQTFLKIVFPQMVKHIMPPVTNEVITLVKDTSLAFALAYTEMFTLAKQIVAARASIMPLFIAGLFYYIFNFIVAFIMEQIEKKLNYYR